MNNFFMFSFLLLSEEESINSLFQISIRNYIISGYYKELIIEKIFIIVYTI